MRRHFCFLMRCSVAETPSPGCVTLHKTIASMLSTPVLCSGSRRIIFGRCQWVLSISLRCSPWISKNSPGPWESINHCGISFEPVTANGNRCPHLFTNGWSRRITGMFLWAACLRLFSCSSRLMIRRRCALASRASSRHIVRISYGTPKPLRMLSGSGRSTMPCPRSLIKRTSAFSLPG